MSEQTPSSDSWTASGPMLTTNATHSTVNLYVNVEMRCDTLSRMSNEFADVALEWGLVGKEVTARCCALIADLYASLATTLRVSEAVAESIPLPVHSDWPND